jgi:hypothetical protein
MVGMSWFVPILACLPLLVDGELQVAQGWQWEELPRDQVPTPPGAPQIEADSGLGAFIHGLDGFTYAIVLAPGGGVRRGDQAALVQGAGVVRFDDMLLETFADGMSSPVALELLDSGELVVLEMTGELRHAVRGSRHDELGLPPAITLSEGTYTSLLHAPAVFGFGDGLLVASVEGGVQALEILQRGSTFVLGAEHPLITPAEDSTYALTLLPDERNRRVVVRSGESSWSLAPVQPATLPEYRPVSFGYMHGAGRCELHFDSPERFMRRSTVESLDEEDWDLCHEYASRALLPGTKFVYIRSGTGFRAGLHAIRRKPLAQDPANLVKFLAHNSSAVRSEALRMLSDLPGDTPPNIDAFLADPAPTVRREAAFTIGLSERRASAPALLAALKLWDDAPLRFTIRQALQRVGGYSVVAARILEDYNPEWHTELFLILDLREKGAADALAGIALFPEAHYTLRVRALRQLSKLDADEVAWDGRTVAEEAYEDALGDVSPLVRLVAIEALERRASESALSRASEVLARETNADVREALTRLIER